MRSCSSSTVRGAPVEATAAEEAARGACLLAAGCGLTRRSRVESCPCERATGATPKLRAKSNRNEINFEVCLDVKRIEQRRASFSDKMLRGLILALISEGRFSETGLDGARVPLPD